MWTRSQNAEIFKPISRILPKLYHTIRSYFTSKLELLWLTKRQLEITDNNFRQTDLKIKFKIFNMGIDFMKNFIYNPNMNSNFISEIGAEWNFCYIIRYELTLQVKLSYFSLLKDN